MANRQLLKEWRAANQHGDYMLLFSRYTKLFAVYECCSCSAGTNDCVLGNCQYLRPICVQSAQVNDFNPEDSDYVRESLLVAVPWFAVAAIVAVAFLLFFLIRCFCFCAGKVCFFMLLFLQSVVCTYFSAAR